MEEPPLRPALQQPRLQQKQGTEPTGCRGPSASRELGLPPACWGWLRRLQIEGVGVGCKSKGRLKTRTIASQIRDRRSFCSPLMLALGAIRLLKGRTVDRHRLTARSSRHVSTWTGIMALEFDRDVNANRKSPKLECEDSVWRIRTRNRSCALGAIETASLCVRASELAPVKWPLLRLLGPVLAEPANAMAVMRGATSSRGLAAQVALVLFSFSACLSVSSATSWAPVS